MTDTSVKRKKYKTPDRVNLTAKSVSVIDSWLKQVVDLPTKLSRSDLVNWLVESQQSELTKREIGSIRQKFFDPLKALEALTVEARKKRSQGEEFDLSELLQANLLRPKTRNRRKKTRPQKVDEKPTDHLQTT